MKAREIGHKQFATPVADSKLFATLGFSSDTVTAAVKDSMAGLSVRDRDVLTELFYVGTSIPALAKQYKMKEDLLRKTRDKALSRLGTLIKIQYKHTSFHSLFPDCIICQHGAVVQINLYLHLWYEGHDNSLKGVCRDMPDSWGKEFISTLSRKPRFILLHITDHLCIVKDRDKRPQRKRMFSAMNEDALKKSIDYICKKYDVSTADVVRCALSFGLPLCLSMFEQRVLMSDFVRKFGMDLLREFIVNEDI
jgi:hypothetical protein